MAPSGWLIEKKVFHDGEMFAIQNSLGVAILLESRLLADGQSDEELHVNEYSEQYTVDGEQELSINYVYSKGFYRHTLTCNMPLALAVLYKPWCQKARDSVEIGLPDTLKAAKLRAENQVPLLEDYVRFADELMRYGAYDEGFNLWQSFAEKFGESGLIAYHYAYWLSTLGRDSAQALDEARLAVDKLGTYGEPLYLLLQILLKEKRYQEMESYLLAADINDEKLAPYRAQVAATKPKLPAFILPKQ